eukprot:759860-Hanusia_phi.AAC.3
MELGEDGANLKETMKNCLGSSSRQRQAIGGCSWMKTSVVLLACIATASAFAPSAFMPKANLPALRSGGSQEGVDGARGLTGG